MHCNFCNLVGFSYDSAISKLLNQLFFLPQLCVYELHNYMKENLHHRRSSIILLLYEGLLFFFGVLENHESMREILSNFFYVMFLLHNSFLTRFKLKFSLFFMCFVFFIYFCLFRLIRSKSEQYFRCHPTFSSHPSRARCVTLLIVVSVCLSLSGRK